MSRRISLVDKKRFYGVMASTLDFESNNPSSSLGRTFIFFLGLSSILSIIIYCIIKCQRTLNKKSMSHHRKT